MRSALAILLAAVSCHRPVSTIEPQQTATPWCFRVAVTFAGRDQAGEVCAETLSLCRSASGIAVDLGGMGGLTQVGACKRGGVQ